MTREKEKAKGIFNGENIMKILKRTLLLFVVIGMLFAFIYMYEHHKTSYLYMNDTNFLTGEIITPTHIIIREYTSDGKTNNTIEITDTNVMQRIKDYLLGIPLRYKGEKIDETTSEKPIGYVSWLYRSPIPDEYVQSITVTFCCYDKYDYNEKIINRIEIYDNQYVVDYNCRAYEIKNREVNIIRDLKNIIN